jgi:hypothetical protein
MKFLNNFKPSNPQRNSVNLLIKLEPISKSRESFGNKALGLRQPCVRTGGEEERRA